MGLRETKAQRTRDALHRATLELVERDGFDAITIEQIAEAAEVGVSTLYRYFPNKDAILLHPVAMSVGSLADHLAARPAEEPIGVALGSAIRELTHDSWADDDEILRLRAQLDVAPGPRARLWDLWNQQRVLLEDGISARTGLETSDLRVTLAAHLTLTVVHMALDLHRDRFEQEPTGAIADRIMALLSSADAIVPTTRR